MCGRFALYHSAEELAERFAVDQVEIVLQPRYNIAPAQPVAVIRQQTQRVLEAFQWGLVPPWVREPQRNRGLINARAETAASKPAYRAAFKHRRCLIPASGFYEWKGTGKERIPHFIHLADGRPFAMAGLWEEQRSPLGEVLRTCAILTTPASEFMAPIHDRMPAILLPDQEAIWLNPAQDLAALEALLRPYAGSDLVARPVSRKVNSPAHDAPDCLAPA